MDMDISFGRTRLTPFRELHVDGVPVAIGRKALALLSVLANARGALVTKDELIDAVWRGLAVEENALHVHIRALRQTLGADADRLRTVWGLGYRLECDGPAPSRSIPSPEACSKPTIAVLAFETLDDDAEAQAFATGVSEEILGSISRIGGVRVLGRGSTFQLRGADKAPARIGTLLHATHILDGTVRRSGHRIRVSVQLVETAEETLVWSSRFDHELADFLTLQDQIAAEVATALKAQFLAPAERAKVDPAALDLYLRGRAMCGPRDSSPTCAVLFEGAVALDPTYAPAWASLALVRGIAARWMPGDEPFAVRAERTRHAAATALALDPTAGTAHLALAYLEPFGAYRTGEALLEKARAVSPAEPLILMQASLAAFNLGRLTESFAFAKAALALDPLDPHITHQYCNLLAERGEVDEAVSQAVETQARTPDYWWTIGIPWLRAAMMRDWATVDRLTPHAEAVALPGMATPRFAVAALRAPTAETKALVKARYDALLAEQGSVDVSMLAFAHNLGLAEEAFGWIARGDYSHLFARDGRIPDTQGFLPGLIFSACNAAMRADVRFVQLCEKIGLNAYWRETGRWPECADEALPYDFRAEVWRLAAEKSLACAA